MYARFDHPYEFPQLGSLLSPGTPEAEFDCDVENVYQWMHVSLPQFDATLNISRDHGWGAIPDEAECQYDADDPRLLALVNPGPTYAVSCGHDRQSNPAVAWRDIADRVGVTVELLSGTLNVDETDPPPTETFTPRTKNGG